MCILINYDPRITMTMGSPAGGASSVGFRQGKSDRMGFISLDTDVQIPSIRKGTEIPGLSRILTDRESFLSFFNFLADEDLLRIKTDPVLLSDLVCPLLLLKKIEDVVENVVSTDDVFFVGSTTMHVLPFLTDGADPFLKSMLCSASDANELEYTYDEDRDMS